MTRGQALLGACVSQHTGLAPLVTSGELLEGWQPQGHSACPLPPDTAPQPLPSLPIPRTCLVVFKAHHSVPQFLICEVGW